MLRLAAVVAMILGTSTGAFGQQRPPIIDMHLHAYGPEWRGGVPNPATGTPAPSTSKEHLQQTLAAMDSHNIVLAIVSGPEASRVHGTDQMRWPDAVGLAVRAIETAEFLTEEQKRDVLYNNAARFLNLTAEEIARHHGR